MRRLCSSVRAALAVRVLLGVLAVLTMTPITSAQERPLSNDNKGREAPTRPGTASSVTNSIGMTLRLVRVFRGGGWTTSWQSARTAYRYRFPQNNRFYDLGFRLARVRAGG